MTTVFVERHIEQVVDGKEFKGYMKVNGVRFEYELRFKFTIPQIASMRVPTNEDEVRDTFQLKVMREGTELELTKKDEFEFFFQMLVWYASEFYFDPGTRMINEGLLGYMKENANGGMFEASTAMTKKGNFDFPPETCQVLNRPKFGCNL